MSAGLPEQIERKLTKMLKDPRKPWKYPRCTDTKKAKTIMHRKERRSAKADPEVFPDYRKYCGWEW